MITQTEITAETFQRVQRIITRQLDVCPMVTTACARLREDLGADSLDLVELVLAISKEFGDQVLDEDLRDVQTVGELAAYIDHKRSAWIESLQL